MSGWPFDPAEVALGLADGAERAEVERLLADDPAFRAEVERQRELAARLSTLAHDAWTPPEPPDLSTPVRASRRTVPRRRLRWIAAPVAACLVGAVAIWITGRGGSPASERMVSFSPVGTATGEVRMAVEPTLTRLTATDIPATDARHHYEAWIADGSGTMRSLGTFDVDAAGDARVEMPGHLDLTGMTALDISLEADDGDPSHSQVSVFHAVL